MDGKRVRQHVVDTVKEKDGQTVPYHKREFHCQPACDAHTLADYITFKEKLGEGE